MEETDGCLLLLVELLIMRRAVASSPDVPAGGLGAQLSRCHPLQQFTEGRRDTLQAFLRGIDE